MSNDETPDPNIFEEISRRNAAKSENQRGISQHTGKPKMKSENFSPEGEINREFDVNDWKRDQIRKQLEIDNKIEKEAVKQVYGTAGRKGIPFKAHKLLGWAGIATTVYEVGSKIYETYKESKENASSKRLENEVEEPGSLINKSKDDKIDLPNPKNEEEKSEPLSQNQPQEEGKDQLQNLSENQVEIDSAQNDRLYNLFHGNLEEPENSSVSDVQDKNGEVQPDTAKTDRLAALFRNDDQELETKNERNEISDGQKEAIYVAFNGSKEDLPENDHLPDDNLDKGDLDRMVALFRGEQQEPEKDVSFDLNDKTEEWQPEQPNQPDIDYSDRLATLFRNDNIGESEPNECSEISDEQKEAIYLAFNDRTEDSRGEDYFPIDKSATEDFTEYQDTAGDEMDIDMDGPDIGGDAGGADGGGE